MPQRTTRVYTDRQRAILGRAARATEDPKEMTAVATLSRLAPYVARILRENPGLTDKEAGKAAALLLRADMIKARAGQRYATDAG